jgi:hypothetical protein
MIRFANASKSHRIQMRIFGTICAISGISLLAIYFANGNAYGHGKADLYIVWYAVTFLVFAVGLLTVRLWAELIFNLCLLCLGAGVVASSVANHETDPSQISIDILVIALLMTPVAICIHRLRHGAYFLRGA